MGKRAGIPGSSNTSIHMDHHMGCRQDIHSHRAAIDDRMLHLGDVLGEARHLSHPWVASPRTTFVFLPVMPGSLKGPHNQHAVRTDGAVSARLIHCTQVQLLVIILPRHRSRLAEVIL